MSEEFRRTATVCFRLSLVALAVFSAGIVAAGWWMGRWWGLGLGAAVGSLVFAAGAVAAGLLYALSQDGG